MVKKINSTKVLKAKYGGINKATNLIHCVIMINGEEMITLCNHRKLPEGCPDADGLKDITCKRCQKRLLSINYEENMKCPNCGDDMKYTELDENEGPAQFSCQKCGVWYNV